LDEALEGSDWSKPFSLLKADMEPWLSVLDGYNQSRLFLRANPAPRGANARLNDDSDLDHAVRALLELKGISTRLIIEPPVQINRQVEYQDPGSEPAHGRDAMLDKRAQELHAKQLAQALEEGRQLGDSLYDAMMGEGFTSLIKAWERRHGGKPSVDDLHMLLSGSRIKADRRPPVAPLIPPEERTAAPARREVVAPVAQHEVPALQVSHKVRTEAGNTPVKTDGARPTRKDKREAEAKPSQKILWYLLHATATACSAAAIVYLWAH
jgi:hypothetical protein